MSRISESRVLITGAASGLGRLMAERFLEKGASRLVLWDINQETLDQAVRDLGDAATGHLVDIANPEEVRTAAADAGPIDILVNNAGIIVGKPAAEHTAADIDRTMGVNALGPMHLTAAILPGMIKRERGHVVNIASAAGMVANPHMAAYVASKFALTGWSESVRLEMEREETGVRVTTVQPYYINTGMFDGVRSPIVPILKPERVVARIVRAVETDRVLLRMPWLVAATPFIKGILPFRAFDFLAGRVFGIYDSMQDFRGRS